MVKAKTCIHGEVCKNGKGILQIPGGLSAYRTLAEDKGIFLIKFRDITVSCAKVLIFNPIRLDVLKFGPHPMSFNF